MEDAPRILKSKRWREKSAAWELERAALLSPEPGKLQICSVGRPNRSVPSLQPCREQALSRGFGVLRLIPGVLLTLPCVQVTPGLIHLQFRFKLGVFRAFQPSFMDKHSWPTDVEGHQPRKVCFADSTSGQHWVCSEIFWVYGEILWVCSEILSTTLLKIAPGY